MRPAAFLDRDGVLNKEKGYLYKIEDFEWILDAKKAIKFLNDKSYYVFVVTNQSGISRGYFKEDDVAELHNYMSRELSRIGAHIDEFFYSPYFPGEIHKKYIHLSHLRKPNTGMLELASKNKDIMKSRSFMIGDKNSDIECAKNFGIRGHLFKNSSLLDFIRDKEGI